MNKDDITKILTTESLAAKRTIERIKLHTDNLSPDFMILFPNHGIDDQRKLVEKSEQFDDPIKFWKSVL